VTDFPKAIYPNAANLPNGKLTANFAGAFSLPSKTLSLKSIEMASTIGTGTGAGELQFEPLARVANAKLTVRDIPLGNLKTLLPSPFNQWIYQGRGGLELDFRGAFGALEVKGVVHSDPLQIRSGSINVATWPSLRLLNGSNRVSHQRREAPCATKLEGRRGRALAGINRGV
jgi:hypothetical protein